MGYSFCAGKIIGDTLYYSDDIINALCRVDLISHQATFVKPFPNEKSIIRNQHIKCLEHQKKLYFIPNSGNYIHILDLYSEEIEYIKVPKQVEGKFAISGACFVDDVLWIFPANKNQSMITLNVVDQSVEQKGNFEKIIENYKKEGVQDIWKIAKVDNQTYFALIGTKIVIRYSMVDESIDVLETNVDGIEAVYACGRKLIICTIDSKVYEWNIKYDSYKEIDFDNKIQEKNAYLVANKNSESLYFIPNTGSSFYKYNMESKQLSRINTDLLSMELLTGVINYAEYDLWDDKVVLFPRIGNNILIIENDSIFALDCNEIVDEGFKKKYYYSLGMFFENEAIKECARIGLDEYIQVLINQ